MQNDNRIKLLLVDDEVKFLESISKRLELKNFDVTSATTGKEAIASAEKGLFDVAVVDFQMPGMDGAQVLKTLKQKHKYIEIIMLTYEARLKKKFEHNQKRIQEIQRLSLRESPFGLLKALARLDTDEK